MPSAMSQTAVPSSGWTKIATAKSVYTVVLYTNTPVRIYDCPTGEPAPTALIDAVPGVELDANQRNWGSDSTTLVDVYARARGGDASVFIKAE